jgi:two-component system response regulator
MGSENDPGQIVVLVVEDDPEDRELIRRGFEECLSDIGLKFIKDGEEAHDYLFRFGRYRERSESPRPRLILLDLYMPRMPGETLLRDVRNDPVLRTIPIVVFTGSEDESDVLRAYDLGANSYFTKPSTIDGYRKVIRILESYWLRRAELPPTA